jgi:hypothetical protein
MRRAKERFAAGDHGFFQLPRRVESALIPQRLGEVELRGQCVGMRLAERPPALGDKGFELGDGRHYAGTLPQTT